MLRDTYVAESFVFYTTYLILWQTTLHYFEEHRITSYLIQNCLLMAESRMFKPLKIGNVEVKHRIGMAPLTRLRATGDRVPVPLMKEYYSQRASVPGTLIISEGTLISEAACGGFANGPGIWSNDQVAAWRTITDEVHSKGCFIFCQLYAMGRAANVEEAKKEGVSIVGPSAIPIEEGAPVPRPMTTKEIKQTVQYFVTASENAIRAGFDGVEFILLILLFKTL